MYTMSLPKVRVAKAYLIVFAMMLFIPYVLLHPTVVFPKPDSGKPIFPKPDSDKPIFPKPDSDKPIFPKPDSDKPIFPKPDSDKPIFPKPESGKPIFPKSESGKPIFPTPDIPNPEVKKPEIPKSIKTGEKPKKVDDVAPRPFVKFSKKDFRTFKAIIKAGAGNVSYIAGVASGSTGSCKQKPPVDVSLLRAVLPPELGQFATEKNYNTLMSLFKAANLASAASTGDPVAIIHLVLFLGSPESPLIPVAELAEEYLPYVVQDFATVIDEVNDKELNSTAIKEYNEQLKTFGEAMIDETTPRC